MFRKTRVDLYPLAPIRVILLSFIAFFALKQTVVSQTITGSWQGLIFTADTTYGSYLPFSMQIVQNGNAVTGISKELIPETVFFADRHVTGTMSGLQFQYDLNGFIAERAPGNRPWCLYVGQMTYDPVAETLEGTWRGKFFDCDSGRIKLWRLQLISDSVFCRGSEIKLKVIGQNVKWYLTNDVGTTELYWGNEITPVLTKSTFFRLTQTHLDTESPPIPLSVIVIQNYVSVNEVTICKGQNYQGLTRPGDYGDTMKASNGCDSIKVLRLKVQEPPSPVLPPTISFCEGGQATLDPGKFDTYVWQDNSRSRSFTATNTGRYSVTVSNGCGSGTASTFIEKKTCNLFPDIFTPNGDGLNDSFGMLRPDALKNFRLIVYNRWGQIVFQTTDPARSWDGDDRNLLQPIGLYSWYCEYVEKGERASSAAS